MTTIERMSRLPAAVMRRLALAWPGTQPAAGAARSASARRPPAGEPAVAAHAMIDALPDATLLVDPELRLRHANAEARRMLGTLRIGEPLVISMRSPELLDAVKAALRTGERTTFELQPGVPVVRRLQGTASPIDGTSGAGSGPAILVILQDLTEREALSRMRMEFVANASHELRTPLAALSGFIETLAGPAKDDPVARQRFLRMMAEQAARMTRLIDDLLQLSRVEMRAHLAPTATADLNLVAAEAARHGASLAARDGTTLRTETAPSPAMVRGDHDELVLAAQNLVINALKYGRPGGTVAIKVSRARAQRSAGDEWRISVEDDGPGIAPEHIPRLTERFYRVSTSASREKGGTGLGLAIVKHIVSRHHGRVDIASELGRGSEFTIALPAAADPAKP